MERINIADSPNIQGLQNLFHEIMFSPTITARFNVVHIILAFIEFAQNPTGIGRYALKKNLKIGEGMVSVYCRKIKGKKSYHAKIHA